MKIATISDLHNSDKLIKEVEKTDVDLLLVAGDLTNKGTHREIEFMLEKINRLNIKTFLIFGNHDISAEIFNFYDYNNITILHNEVIEYNGITIYGSPYSARFGSWAFSYDSEEEMKRYLPEKRVDIIMTHGGPRLECNITNNGSQTGSEAVKEYIEKYKPEVSISGHIHERGGYNKIYQNTRIINTSLHLTLFELRSDMQNDKTKID